MKGKNLIYLSLGTGDCMLQTNNYFHGHTSWESRFLEMAQKSLQPGGVQVIGNITFEAERHGEGYMGTLYANTEGEKVPLLMTFGAKTNYTGKMLWELLRKRFRTMPEISMMEQNWPHAPFVADYVADYVINVNLLGTDAFKFFFSGKRIAFCKCIGWAFLFPGASDTCPDMAEKGSTEGDGVECLDIADVIEWLAATAGAPAICEMDMRFYAMGATRYLEYKMMGCLIKSVSDLVRFAEWAAPLLDSNLAATELDAYLSAMKECPDMKATVEWLTTAKGNHCMSGMASRTGMMEEAVRRMEMLGLAQEAVSNFRKSGKLDSVMEGGRSLPLAEADQKRIQNYEALYGVLAYAAVRAKAEYGRTINYIMVSRNKEDWPMDRKMIGQGTVRAYGYNYDIPTHSESGSACIERLPNGTLKRIW